MKQTSQIPPEHPIDPTVQLVGVFARDQDLWTLGLSGTSFTIPAIKGLSYIQRLLQHPGQEFHSLDLVRDPGAAETSAKDTADHAALLADPAVAVGDIGDSGEMLDAQAIANYRNRLNELQAELEEARDRDNFETGVRLEEEIDALKREISRAVGLGGRMRRAGSAAERARLNATRAIKGAVQKIRDRDAMLAGLLEVRIRTGAFCQYVEDSPAVKWQFSIGAAEAQPVVSPAPFVKRDDSAMQIAAAVNRTTFVGRESERESIRGIIARVRRGEGRAVALSGPPGVGKTRIALEVAAEAAASGFLTLVGHCYDRKDSVPYVPFVEILESALAQSNPPRIFRDALGHSAAEVARLIPQLRRIFDDIPPPLEVSAEQSRRILFDAIAQLLTRAAAGSAVLLLLDDLHWADEGTLSLLSHLARVIANQPVLLMLTYRDDELEPAGALARSLDDLIRLHLLERVELRGLPKAGVGEMIRALSGHDAPLSVVDLIHSYTDGNPFFIEELIKHLLERGRLLDADGEIRRDMKSDDVDVPQSLRLVIGRRIARLSDATQKALGVASVIGPSFSFELLESASGIDPDSLLDCVEEAEGLSLISSRLVRLESRFEFPHELVRQAVLGSISPARRQRLHLSVANAIERIHADALEDHAADMAHHLWHAGAAAETAKTLHFMASAARRGLQQSGYEVALGQFAKALELVQRLPDSNERMRLELDLQIDNGIAILATRGWYVPEMGSAYQRARELCQALGDDSHLFSVSYGLWSFHLVRGEHLIARTYADELLRLLPQNSDDGSCVLADWASGCSQFFMGEFESARASLEHCIEGYNSGRHRSLALRFGQDPCVSALCYDALTLWMLGLLEEGESRARAALSLARELGHPFTLAWCLSNLVMYRLLRRDFDQVASAIEEGLAITQEHGFAFYEEQFQLFRRLASTARGNIERAPAGANRQRRFGDGYDLAGTWARSVIAEALAGLSRPDIALKALQEAAQLMERNAERYVEAELMRVGGEVMVRQVASKTGQEADAILEEATRQIRDAIDIATKRGGKMLALRASVSLAKLLIRADKTAEANSILKTALTGFAESLNAPDLTAARELLSGAMIPEPDSRSAASPR